MKCTLLCLLLVAVVGNLSAATSFSATGVSADLNVSDQHTLAVSISGTFVATIVLERQVSGGYIPQETWTAGITYKPPRLTGVWRLRCSDFTSGTATYTLTSVADNQVIYRKPDGTTAFSVDVDGVVTNSGGATSGGTIDNAVIGGVTPASGTFTTLFATSVSGPSIDNAIIGGTTPAAASFTTASATGAITSTLATGTAPLTVASTTKVTNLNADLLDGTDWRAPGTIGGTTPGAGSFTTLTASSTFVGSDTLTVNKDSDYSSNVGGLTTKGVTAPNATLRIGVTTTPVYFIQANLDGTGSRPLALNPGGGDVLVATATDDGANKLQVAGNLSLTTAGNGLKIKEGSNARMGSSALSGGAVVVSNTSVTANTRIFVTSNADGGTPGWLRVSARTASTSFTITSSSGTDTSTVAWLLVEPSP